MAGDGLVTFRECAEITGLKVRKMPVGLARRMAAAMWKLHMSESPPGQVRFAEHPWVVSNEKLKRETGWQPRHSSRETFEITMRAQGLLGGAEQPARAPEPGVPAAA